MVKKKSILGAGTLNKAKLASLEAVFGEDCEIKAVQAHSGVSAQPMSDEETRAGAVNRALYTIEQTKGDLAAGLEGGIMYIDGQAYICNWGALVTAKGNIFTAAGARIPLPAELVPFLEKGMELGDVMDEYARRQGVREKEGAVGILTNGAVTRDRMFTHINLLLKGQLDRYENR